MDYHDGWRKVETGPFVVDPDDGDSPFTEIDYQNPGLQVISQREGMWKGARSGTWGDGGPSRVVGQEKGKMFALRASHVLGRQFDPQRDFWGADN